MNYLAAVSRNIPDGYNLIVPEQDFVVTLERTTYSESHLKLSSTEIARGEHFMIFIQKKKPEKKRKKVDPKKEEKQKKWEKKNAKK